MKRSVFLLSLVALLIVFSAISQAFEGIIVQKTTRVESGVNPGLEAMKKMLEQMPVAQRKMMEDRFKAAMGDKPSAPKVSMHTTYIKGPKMRVDFENEKDETTFMVMDMEKKVVRNFFPQRNAYVEMNLDELQQMGQGFSNMKRKIGQDMGKETTGELEKTGEKKQINDYMCEQYTQQVGDYTNEYWITKEITMKQIMGDYTDNMKMFGEMGGQNPRQKALMNLDGYPILSLTKNKYGTNRNEVTKIEKIEVADDLFGIPNGYKKQSMQDMMNR